VALAEKYEGVFASVGVHPNDCEGELDEALAALRALATHPKVVAIGETGLDYHYLPSKTASKIRQLAEPPLTITATPPEKTEVVEPSDLADDIIYKSRQVAFFRGHLELARELGKPVIIHQRDAFDDVMSILTAYCGPNAAAKGAASVRMEQGSVTPQKLRGVFHCFGENWQRGQQVLALGFNVGFTGILTFKNATALRDVAAALPMDRILVETDCPYLAPEPFRGKRCEPAHVRLTAQRLAELRGVTLEEVGSITTQAAEKLFFA
jgi:TatD DNase family protein